MVKVQKELSFLKNKQAEQAGKLMKDDDITNLQSSIAWFKSEAVKLNQILDDQKSQMHKSKFRLQQGVGEQAFLVESLKETRRQNKLMSLATEKTVEQNKALENFFQKNCSECENEYNAARDLP